MDWVATLLTDIRLDESSLRGVLFDCSQTALAGSIVQDGLTAVHSFGDADADLAVSDIQVSVRSTRLAAPAVLSELAKHAFRPLTALEFEAPSRVDAREDAWMLLGIYAAQLRGWAVTQHLDYEEAACRLGDTDGLLRAPMGGRHGSILVASSALAFLTG